MKPKKFEVLADRTIRDIPYAKKHDIVYDFWGTDYGLANDDTRWTGVEHTSVTKNADGSAPSFTIAKSALKLVE